MPNAARKIDQKFEENNVFDIPKPATGHVSTEDAQAILGVKERAFRNFGLDPVRKIGRRNFFALDDVLDLRDKRIVKKARPAIAKELTNPIELAHEKAKLLRARRIGLEIRNARNLGRLVPLDDVNSSLERVRWALRRTVEECAHLTRLAKMGRRELDLDDHERKLEIAMRGVETMDLTFDQATRQRIERGDNFLRERPSLTSAPRRARQDDLSATTIF